MATRKILPPTGYEFLRPEHCYMGLIVYASPGTEGGDIDPKDGIFLCLKGSSTEIRRKFGHHVDTTVGEEAWVGLELEQVGVSSLRTIGLRVGPTTHWLKKKE